MPHDSAIKWNPKWDKYDKDKILSNAVNNGTRLVDDKYARFLYDLANSANTPLNLHGLEFNEMAKYVSSLGLLRAFEVAHPVPLLDPHIAQTSMYTTFMKNQTNNKGLIIANASLDALKSDATINNSNIVGAQVDLTGVQKDVPVNIINYNPEVAGATKHENLIIIIPVVLTSICVFFIIITLCIVGKISDGSIRGSGINEHTKEIVVDT